MTKSQLVVRENGDGTWTLVEPLVHESPAGSFVVPAGFVTDFASVPRILWSVIAPTGAHSRAAVIHDFLYAAKPPVSYNKDGVTVRMPLARSQADTAFYEAMLADGVPPSRAWVMWAAVRLFGWKPWRDHG